MKKLLIIGSVFAVGLAVNSCKKEVKTTSEPIADQKSLISLVSENYRKGKIEHLDSKAGKWRKILGADLTGALSGGAIGGAIGAGIGGLGAGPGALIGACLGGAGASFTAAGLMAPNTGFGNVINIPENPANAFDFCGKMHYSSMDALLLQRNSFWVNNTINYSTYENLIFNNVSAHVSNASIYKPNFSPSVFKAEIDFHAKRSGNIASYMVRDNLKLANLSNSVISILSDYARSLDVTNDKEAFRLYSISCESAVTTSSLSAIDKQHILTAMSVARYGVAYYF